ncbi:MAG: TlpA family protein disulfide reductase, partial [Chitinophagaceae bacterium]
MKVGLFRPKIELNDPSASNLPVNLSDIYFKDGNGHTFSLSSLKGKVVFINFWATWCPPCRAELPSIKKLYEKFKDNNKIMFLMVDVDEEYKHSS